MLLRKADGRGGFHPLYNPQTVPAFMEHETGIEPALSAWKAEVLAIKRLVHILRVLSLIIPTTYLVGME